MGWVYQYGGVVPAAVQTADLALSAVSDLYVGSWQGDKALTSTYQMITETTEVPGERGFAFIAVGQVLFGTGGNNDAGVWARIRRGSVQIAEIAVADGTSRSINWGIPIAVDGGHPDDQSFYLDARVASGNASAKSAVLSVFVAKR